MEYQGVDAAMRERVRQTLCEVERKYGIKVLYACESGESQLGVCVARQ